jgi:cation:H+ antiporter
VDAAAAGTGDRARGRARAGQQHGGGTGGHHRPSRAQAATAAPAAAAPAPSPGCARTSAPGGTAAPGSDAAAGARADADAFADTDARSKPDADAFAGAGAFSHAVGGGDARSRGVTVMSRPSSRAFPWQYRVATASGAAVAGLITAAVERQLPPIGVTAGLGIGLVGASLLLAWSGDALDSDVRGGLVWALVSLIAVMPELVIEVHLAATQQSSYVTANLTGATRLLLTAAIALPTLGAALWRMPADRPRPAVRLGEARRVDLGVLLLASACAVRVLLHGRLTLVDGAVLGSLYVVYLRRVQRSGGEPAAVIGVAAAIAALPAERRRLLSGALMLFAGFAVFRIAQPFPDALLAAGTRFGLDPYLLIQSVVPLATETPEMVVVTALVAARRPAQGIALLLASAVAQWTLAFASVSVAYAAGGGGVSLLLTGRERVELLLTVATTLMAVAAFASLKPDRVDAWIVLLALGAQLAYPGWATRVAVALVLAVFAVDILANRRRAVRPMLASLRPGR